MSVEKEFVPYQETLALKELGFDEPCLSYYEGESFSYHLATITSGDNYIIPAPLYQQAFRWFREKYDLYSFIERDGSIFNAVCQHTLVRVCRTYEEAELACLKKLIEIVKNK